MKPIISLPSGSCGIIRKVNGDRRFLSRISAIGLIPGTPVQLIKNQKNHPTLLYAKDTLIAINRKESEKILMEVVE